MLLQGIESVVGITLSFGLSNLNLTAFGIDFFLFALSSRFLGLLLGWSIILLLCALLILGTEVDQLLAKINLAFVGVFVKLLKLCKLPLALLSLLRDASLLLLCFNLSFILCLLFSPLFALLVSSALLELVLCSAFGALSSHLLGLGHPLDVLDEHLLDLVVTHQPIESFLELIFTLLYSALLLKILLNFGAHIGQIILFQLLFFVIN